MRRRGHTPNRGGGCAAIHASSPIRILWVVDLENLEIYIKKG
jgi:hypothetical protein